MNRLVDILEIVIYSITAVLIIFLSLSILWRNIVNPNVNTAMIEIILAIILLMFGVRIAYRIFNHLMERRNK